MPTFKEQMEDAPLFAQEFITRVEQEFDNNYIAYINVPDMRIRRKHPHGNIINAVTIAWRPKLRHFEIATPLRPGVVRSFGLTVDVRERTDSLSFVFCLDETIINQETSRILGVINSAHSLE